MAKYLVYAQTNISKLVGEFEADSEDDAIDKAIDSGEDYFINLCHSCSRNAGDLGDVELVAEKDED